MSKRFRYKWSVEDAAIVRTAKDNGVSKNAICKLLPHIEREIVLRKIISIDKYKNVSATTSDKSIRASLEPVNYGNQLATSCLMIAQKAGAVKINGIWIKDGKRITFAEMFRIAQAVGA